tara:strand:+ start:14379 stop:15113 length:735 start_codon:yes stop_codon:yes gene_type:complete
MTNLFRILELKVLEPLLYLARPMFSTEEEYYAAVMNWRTRVRAVFGRTPTASPESSEREAEFYLRKISQKDVFLEYGCGSCGLAVHVINVLDKGNYVGCDISEGALTKGRSIVSENPSLEKKAPVLILFKDLAELSSKLGDRKFDWIVLNSVFTHLSEDKIIECLKFFKSILATNGVVVGDFSVPRLSAGSFSRRGIDYYYSIENILALAQKSNIYPKQIDGFDVNQSTVYESVIFEFRTNVGE